MDINGIDGAELGYLLALHFVEGLGPARIKKLFDYFGSFEAVWNAKVSEYNQFKFPEKLIENLKIAKKSVDPDEYLLRLQKNGIKIITIFDKNYPKLLKEIHDPPMIIYYKGEISDEVLGKCFAVVGTRKPTGYGRVVTEKLTRELAGAGLTIVSGLARGVDTIAHKVTIEANCKTLAVLGGGLNQIFPSENLGLAEKIASGFGAVLTEFPPSYPHLAGNFPARNRIISGLSKGVLVTEAAEDSGSLITARLALEQNREVFAVPGPITSSMSEGTSFLLKEGAKLVSSAQDILDELGIKPRSKVNLSTLNLTKEEAEILDLIKDESRHVDELSRILKKPIAEISGILLKLEIIGIVKNLGAGNYIELT
ncbi:DNA-protecting protein DprA [Candidatus Daviesbacteria bacterium]|nr:DNA-protecting protein DprA [Candidatus Daviesbacteria bacterium]